MGKEHNSYTQVVTAIVGGRVSKGRIYCAEKIIPETISRMNAKIGEGNKQ